MANPGSCSNPLEDEAESEISDRFSKLLDVLVQHCLAKIPRSGYSSLSRVCKLWQNQIHSKSLYTTRRTLKDIDFSLCLNVRLPLNRSSVDKWYEFFPSSDSNIPSVLFKMTSLLPCVQPIGASVVSVGANIYIIGGKVDDIPSKSMWVYNFVFDQWEQVESQMAVTRCYPDVVVVNNKIYVMGGCAFEDPNWVEVFDPKTRKWSSLPSPNLDEPLCCQMCAVVKGKIMYHAHHRSIFEFLLVLDTSSNVWTKLPDRGRMPFKRNPMTVIDGVLYCSTDGKIRGFDYEKNEWKKFVLMKGALPVRMNVEKMVNMNGRLVLVGTNDWVWKTVKFYCAMIEVRKDEDNTLLRGSVVWAGFMGKAEIGTYIEDCFAIGL